MIELKLIDKIYNDKTFMKEATPILTHSEFVKTKSIVHHGGTRFNHSVKVAYLSYVISRIMGADTTSAIRAGMLHDFFLERDDTNIKTSTKMLVNHPTIAKQNAINYFSVNEKEQNIIESHMFPFSSVVPRFKEAWIVSACDKMISAFEGVNRFKTQLGAWLLFVVNFMR